MKRLIALLLNGAALGGLLSVFCGEAAAIPVFARRYGTSCTTCHVIIPKLNHFGLAFRANGYRIPVNDEKFFKQENVSLGAPAWKNEWPKRGVWPGAIADRPPIAVRFQLDTNIFGSGSQPHLNFDTPHELSFYTGGTLGTGISYFGEVEFKAESSGESEVELSLAFINFDHLFGTTLANIRFGRFEPVAAPFSRFWRRLTSADYNVTEYLAFTDPSPGSFSFKSRQMGVEFWGGRTGPNGHGGIEYGIGLVNGADSRKDTNTKKDVEWSLAYKFGGYGITGPTMEEPESLLQANNFIDNSIKIGTFGIAGRRGIGATEDKYHRVGVKFDAFIQRLNLYGAYVRGRDRFMDDVSSLSGLSESRRSRLLIDPATRTTGALLAATEQVFGRLREIESSAWFVEADYVLTPWIVPLVRYEKTDVTELFGTPQPSVVRIVPAVRFAIRANVVLLVEGRFHRRDPDFGFPAKRSEGRVRIDFLF